MNPRLGRSVLVLAVVVLHAFVASAQSAPPNPNSWTALRPVSTPASPKEITFPVTVQASQGGGIVLDPPQPPEGYPADTSVTVTAEAGAGHAFSSWIGALSGTVSPAVLLVDGPKLVGAVFVMDELKGSGESAVGALDTVPPTLDSAQATSESSMVVSFSEPMLAPGVTTPDNYAVSGMGAGTLGAHPAEVSAGVPHTLTWAAGEMQNGAALTLAVTGLRDAVGNLMDSEHSSASGMGMGIAPVFSALSVTPAQASAGDTVAVTFTASEPLDGNPLVTVNGHDAAWVGGAKETGFTYSYIVQTDDPPGMAVLSVTGFDLAGNMGSLSASAALEIVEVVPAVPLCAWPLAFLLLAAGVPVLAWRRRRAAVLILLLPAALAVAPAAFAEAPTVSNVTFTQGPNGAARTKVDIYYDLVAPDRPCDITVALSKDSGADGFVHPVSSVTGDTVGVKTGTGHHILWDIAADYPKEVIPQAQIRLVAAERVIETVLLPGDVPLLLKWVPGGTFMMGRYLNEQDSIPIEDPRHTVTLGGFWMGKYELTKRQWTAVMGTAPWEGQFNVSSDPDSPAVHVSWNDGQALVVALNGLTGKTFRLPSESQWEYACRAGTTARFYWGDDLAGTLINDCAWWNGNAYSAGQAYAHAAGQKAPNAFGLYDMSGNVWEWCEDDLHGSYTGAPADGSAWVSAPRGLWRILRGGGWNYEVPDCRSANRYFGNPADALSYFGLRLVLTP